MGTASEEVWDWTTCSSDLQHLKIPQREVVTVSVSVTTRRLVRSLGAVGYWRDWSFLWRRLVDAWSSTALGPWPSDGGQEYAGSTKAASRIVPVHLLGGVDVDVDWGAVSPVMVLCCYIYYMVWYLCVCCMLFDV